MLGEPQNIVEDDFPIVLKEKKNEYENVWTFIFSSEQKLPYWAGQSAHVTFKDERDPDHMRRSMSFASSPYDEDIQFSMRVRDQSPYKMNMSKLKIGDELHITRIKGGTVLPDDDTLPLVMIAGGIGVTPFRSMMRTIEKRGLRHEVTFIHVSSSEYLYEEELKKLPFVQLRISRADVESTLDDIVSKNPEAEYFIAGSPSFLNSITESLIQKGIYDEHIKSTPFKKYDDFIA